MNYKVYTMRRAQYPVVIPNVSDKESQAWIVIEFEAHLMLSPFVARQYADALGAVDQQLPDQAVAEEARAAGDQDVAHGSDAETVQCLAFDEFVLDPARQLTAAGPELSLGAFELRQDGGAGIAGLGARASGQQLGATLRRRFDAHIGVSQAVVVHELLD